MRLFDADELAELTSIDDRDYFQTPACAIRPLLPYLRQDWRIWEPACGEGNIIRFLCDAGFKMTGSDILGGYDFFDTDRNCDAIVTNPPYSIMDRWLQRCYEIGKPFALLLPVTALGGKGRQDMFREHGVQIMMLGQRVAFKTPTGREGKKSCPTFETAWFCWQMELPDSLTFATMGEND